MKIDIDEILKGILDSMTMLDAAVETFPIIGEGPEEAEGFWQALLTAIKNSKRAFRRLRSAFPRNGITIRPFIINTFREQTTRLIMTIHFRSVLDDLTPLSYWNRRAEARPAASSETYRMEINYGY